MKQKLEGKIIHGALQMTVVHVVITDLFVDSCEHMHWSRKRWKPILGEKLLHPCSYLLS